MPNENYVSGIVRERYDDVARTYTAYNAAGAQTSTRPYTAAENANADAAAVTATARTAAASKAARDAAILEATATTAKPPASGATWVQPTGAHDAYALDSTVTFGGKTYISVLAFNVWAPASGIGQREVVAGGGPAPWVQPVGSQDAYAVGAKVTYQGQTWVNSIAANVWPPGVAGWTVTP